MARAVYPGTFDPVTNGHLDVIERGARLFDHLLVGVAVNVEKTPLFPAEERVAMIRNEVAGMANVEVEALSGLVVDHARKVGCDVILRGLRTVSDFELEFQMALTNRSFAPDVETVFVMPNERYAYTSSRLIKEAVSLGGDVSAFLPRAVLRRLMERLHGGENEGGSGGGRGSPGKGGEGR